MRNTQLADLPTLERTAVCFALVVLYTQGWEARQAKDTLTWSTKHFKPQILDRLRAKGLIEEAGKTGKVVRITPLGVQHAKAYVYNLTELDVW
jgi:DNA-binding PadR family transcriptional regulator